MTEAWVRKFWVRNVSCRGVGVVSMHGVWPGGSSDHKRPASARCARTPGPVAWPEGSAAEGGLDRRHDAGEGAGQAGEDSEQDHRDAANDERVLDKGLALLVADALHER